MNIDNDNFLGRWLADDLSEEEKIDFENSQEYLAYKDIIKGTEKFERPFFDIEKGLKNQKEFNKTYQEPSKNKVIKLRTWIYSAAAVAIVLIGLKTVFFTTTKISTAMAETKNWTLPDNSIVTLNADSSIEYDKKSFAEDRVINLEGEAFFDVAKGSRFTVKTKNGDITVLGTEFNVYSREKTIEVQCFEGKVQVSNHKDIVILTPEKGVKSDADKTLHLLEIKDSQPSWTQGRSSFNQVTLQRITDELERQYNIQINTTNVDLSRLFSGFFVHNDLDSALKTCFEPMNISYIFKNSKNIELKNK